ncbi:MAG: histidine kinase, partial [Verrucomicrobiota bacterium]
MMTRDKSLRILLRGWCYCLPAWGALSLALSLQLSHVASMPLVEAFRVTSVDWLGWAVVSPFLYLLTTWLPLEKATWRRALPAHLLGGVIAIALVICVRSLFGVPPRLPQGFPPNLRHGPPRGIDLNQPPDFHPEPPGPPPQPGFYPHPNPQPGGSPRMTGPDWFFKTKLPLHLPVFLVILAAAHALYFYKRGQERERQTLELTAGLAQARLDALKMQIQPHFLFNALNSIAALVHKDPVAADEMIGALSEFLRCTLAGSARQEVSLLEELEFVRRYLAIELVRFGDRLQCEQDVPPETFGALVPMLILQPLVENAVRHGLSSVTGPARLTIRARRERDTLKIIVADNGPGSGSDAGEGIGLANTRARLQELHGNRAQVEIRTDGGF